MANLWNPLFRKSSILGNLFPAGSHPLKLASWLSHAPKSPKPKFAKNKRHFKIFKESKEWEFREFRTFTGHFSYIFLGFLWVSHQLTALWFVHETPSLLRTIPQWLAGSPGRKTMRWKTVQQWSCGFQIGKCGEVASESRISMNDYECLWFIGEPSIFAGVKRKVSILVLCWMQIPTQPHRSDPRGGTATTPIFRRAGADGCLHPKFAWEACKACSIWPSIPPKKVGLRWSVYIADGEIPTWFGWWIPTTSQKTGLRTGVIPSGELTFSFCHGKSPFYMGKSTISMAIFNSFLYVHQRVNPINIPLNPIKPPFSYGFPMVFLWL